MYKSNGKGKRFDHVAKHHFTIWQTMRKILDAETWDKTLTDTKLTKAIREQGVFATDTMTRDVRVEHNIGNADERRISTFARAHKEKQKREGK